MRCRVCGLVQRLEALAPGMVAECAQCGGRLAHHKPNSLARTAAFSLAALSDPPHGPLRCPLREHGLGGLPEPVPARRDARRDRGLPGHIPQRYARLVRIGSRFWTVGGVDVDFGLFRGLQVNVDSLRSRVTGGIAFATPEDADAPPAKETTLFRLHDKPQKEWLDWRPKVAIPAGD